MRQCREKKIYWYTKAVFEPPKSVRLEIAREDLEFYLRATYNNPEVTTLGSNEDINIRQHPATTLTIKPPTMTEVKDYLKHCSNKSAPGHHGLPYVGYKRCPTLRA